MRETEEQSRKKQRCDKKKKRAGERQICDFMTITLTQKSHYFHLRADDLHVEHAMLVSKLSLVPDEVINMQSRAEFLLLSYPRPFQCSLLGQSHVR